MSLFETKNKKNTVEKKRKNGEIFRGGECVARKGRTGNRAAGVIKAFERV